MQIGFMGLLTIVFVVAKLMGIITWSWWLVLLPSLISAAIGTILLLIVIIAGMAGGK